MTAMSASHAATAGPTGLDAPEPPRAGPRDYLRIARLDHATKHIFVVPGILLALMLRGPQGSSLIADIALGFLAAVAVASANYVINEWLDREFDRFHPEKSQRAAVQRRMSGRLVLAEYAAFLLLGLGFAALVNEVFFVVALLFAVSGLTYNVEPIRTKDRAYVDVLTESINNPLRLLMGWAMVDATSLPPVSMIASYWFGGAFLTNCKRLSEYRDIVASDGREVLARYRRSFAHYDESRLSVANLVYALLCAFFLAIFLIKYRIEYTLLFPCVVVLFGVYYAVALKPGSVARRPEALYRSGPVVLAVTLTVAMFLFTTFVDLPRFADLTNQTFIEFR